MENKDVVIWFKSQLTEGFTRGQLIETLRESGYSAEHIEELLEALEPKKPKPTKPALWKPFKWGDRQAQPKVGPAATTTPASSTLPAVQTATKKKPKKRSKVLLFGVLAIILLAIAGVSILFIPGIIGDIQIQKDCYSLPSEKDYIDESVVLCRKSYAGSVVEIRGDNLVFDCNGSVLDGGGSNNGIIISGRSNVVVKNCNLKGYETGIYVSNSEHIVIIDNTLGEALPDSVGILIQESTKSIVDSNNVAGISRGISLRGSSQNNVLGNTVSGGSTGLFIEENSDNNMISRNKVSSSQIGIAVRRSTNNVFVDNVICYNDENGYDFFCDSSQFGHGNRVDITNVNYSECGLEFSACT